MSNRMPPFKHHTTRLAQRVLGVLVLLLLAMLACSLPILSEETSIPPSATVEQIVEEGTAIVKTAEPPPPPTPTAQTLPPDLIESDPASGSEISLQQQVTLYFNQPMNKDTVEAASGGLQGQFEWPDDATVVFTPAELFPPSSQVALTFNTSARAANGLLLQEPIALIYRTVGTLNLTQQIPASGTDGVDPASAIVASFNRPVVPLGAETESYHPAFTMEPEAGGRWEWINTSTCVF